MIYLAFYGLLHGGKGPGGSVGDENDLCMFVVSFLPFVFHFLSQELSFNKKIFWICVFLLGVAAAVSTMSRGGFLGLLAMGSVYWYFSRRKILILLCFIMLGLGVYLLGGESYKNEMSSVTDTKESTASERLLSWQAAFKIFLDKPWGVGGNNFQRHFQEYQPDEIQRGMWGRLAHSLWFTLIPETGLIGIWIYFSLIYFNIRDIYRIRRNNSEIMVTIKTNYAESMSICLIASFSGFFVAGSFVSVLYYPIFWYLTSILICFRNITPAIKHANQAA
jgi:O-antigen ligase